jgi:hypothetical protein
MKCFLGIRTPSARSEARSQNPCVLPREDGFLGCFVTSFLAMAVSVSHTKAQSREEEKSPSHACGGRGLLRFCAMLSSPSFPPGQNRFGGSFLKRRAFIRQNPGRGQHMSMGRRFVRFRRDEESCRGNRSRSGHEKRSWLIQVGFARVADVISSPNCNKRSAFFSGTAIRERD